MRRPHEKVDEYLVLSLCAIAAGLLFAGAGVLKWRQSLTYDRLTKELRAVHEQVRQEAGEILAERDSTRTAPQSQSQFNTLLDNAGRASRIDPAQILGTTPSREELPEPPYARVTYDVELKDIAMPQLADLFYNLKSEMPGAPVRVIRATAEPKQPGLYRVHFQISFAAAAS